MRPRFLSEAFVKAREWIKKESDGDLTVIPGELVEIYNKEGLRLKKFFLKNKMSSDESLNFLMGMFVSHSKEMRVSEEGFRVACMFMLHRFEMLHRPELASDGELTNQ